MGYGRQPATERFLSTVATPNPIEFNRVEVDDHIDAIEADLESVA